MVEIGKKHLDPNGVIACQARYLSVCDVLVVEKRFCFLLRNRPASDPMAMRLSATLAAKNGAGCSSD
jgi:hypothetical protein